MEMISTKFSRLVFLILVSSRSSYSIFRVESVLQPVVQGVPATIYPPTLNFPKPKPYTHRIRTSEPEPLGLSGERMNFEYGLKLAKSLFYGPCRSTARLPFIQGYVFKQNLV